MFFTSNLFSQTLPYEVGSLQSIPSPDGGILTSNGWSFTFMEQIFSTWTNLPANITESTDWVTFQTSSSPWPYIATATKEVTGMSGVSNINYEIKYNMLTPPNGSSAIVNFSFLGSNDGITWNLIDTVNNVSSGLRTVQSSFNNSNNYTWIKIKFDEDRFSTIQLVYVKISDLSTGIKLNDISDKYTIYSYDKNIVVNSNDSKEYNLTVYNLSGQEVFNKTTRGNNKFNLNVSNGMYLVKIDNGIESFNQKIVIQ